MVFHLNFVCLSLLQKVEITPALVAPARQILLYFFVNKGQHFITVKIAVFLLLLIRQFSEASPNRCVVMALYAGRVCLF